MADPQLLAGLGRIGGNLNQIARQVNTVESDIEKSELLPNWQSLGNNYKRF